MQTEHMFVIWGCNRIKGKFHAGVTDLSISSSHSSFSTDHSTAVPLLQYFFFCALVGCSFLGVFLGFFVIVYS